jgi:HEAT repeats
MRLLAALFFIAVMLIGCSEAGNKGNQFSQILSELGPASPEANRATAAIKLQQMGTNAFPFLVAEMNSFKWHTPEEKDEKILSRTRRLRGAFQVLGANLLPMTGEFVRDLDTNRNFVNALDGLCAIGEQGVPFIIGAMTNRQSALRLNAIGAVLKMGTNFNTAGLALPNLIFLLNDESVLVRSLAIETIGVYCNEPSTVISPLFKVARSDPDLVIRVQGIKAIWRIQTRNRGVDADTKARIEEISKSDESSVVRACAERFLAGRQM